MRAEKVCSASVTILFLSPRLQQMKLMIIMNCFACVYVSVKLRKKMTKTLLR